MVHIKLITIKRQLQAKMQYPLTKEEAGDEFLTLDEAFDELLSGFDKWLVRNKLGSKMIVFYARQNGWLTEKMADLFTDYCITGWRVI